MPEFATSPDANIEAAMGSNYPRAHALKNSAKPAVIMAETGETLTYGELESRANQLAHVWRSLGLTRGDTIAIMLENSPHWFDLYWSAQRSGLYVTPVPVKLTAGELAYIANDSSAKVVVTSGDIAAAPQFIQQARELAPSLQHIFYVGTPLRGAKDLAGLQAAQSILPISDETAGFHMTYSSGTTGKPKGIKLPLMDGPPDIDIPMVKIIQRDYAVDQSTIYLSPAPLYHTAPLMFCTAMHRLGATAVVIQHFEPEEFLKWVQTYKASFTQLVPT
ncbi:MAG: AMP-binding protein, partial [Acetobacteraceae bacterium]|nr:AMP-binding protein [Acetobacteraceae bacterium]